MKRLLILSAALTLFGGLALAQGPVIAANGVQDAASYTPNVAQGSVFVVKGTNLCSPGLVQASLPLPTVLNSVRIIFTPVSGGAAIDAWMVYTYNQGGVTQLAAVLPSTAATGAYNVTVNNGGQASAASRTEVVARKYSIITVNGSGAGRAVIQNYISASQLDLNRFTAATIAGFTASPARPGQTLILWGTGLGPVTGGSENSAPVPVDLRAQANVTVIVGSVEIPALFAGRAQGLPGADQINFTLPSAVPTGCNVPLTVRVGSALSNVTTLAIAGSGDACSHPQYNRSTLARLDQGGTMVTGSFVLSSLATSISVAGFTINTNSESVTGSFARFGADQIDDASPLPATVGSCQVYKRTGSQTTLLTGVPAQTLDAGAALTLNGPNVSNKSVPRLQGNVYSQDLASAAGGGLPGIPGLPGGGAPPAAVIAAGTYTLRGTGGADVGAFNANITIGTPVRVGTIPATIPRNQNLTVTWTGGGSDLVAISGVSGTNAAGSSQTNPLYDATVFICTTTADRGSFTVPSSVLSQMTATPAGGIASGNGIGVLAVVSSSVPSATSGIFTAPLTAGVNIDGGVFVSTVGSLGLTEYR